MRTIQTSVNLPVRPASLWQAITDHEALANHTSFLREVRVLETQEGGVGTTRQCTLSNGKSFTERITAWEDGRLYCYSPDTTQSQLPFRWAEACWSIEPRGEGSRLTYRLQYEPRSRLRDIVNYTVFRTYGVWQIRRMLKSYDRAELLATDGGH